MFEGSQLHRRRLLLGVFAAAVCLMVIYLFVDPAHSVWMPKCMFHSLTGLKCPGCGTQRMAYALLHGDFVGAVRQNALFLILTPVLLFLGWLEWNSEKHAALYAKVYQPWLIWTLAGIIVAWWLARNLFDF